MTQSPDPLVALTALAARATALLSKQLWQQGDYRQAATTLDQAIALAPDAGGWQIRRSILIPPVPASSAEIDETREDCRTRLLRLVGDGPPPVSDPVADIDWTSYLLSYHGLHQNGAMNRLFHRVCAMASPGLDWQAPHCAACRKPGRTRVGFISWYFNDHTIRRLFGGLIERVDPDGLDVRVFGIEGNDAFLRDGMLYGKRAVPLPADLHRAREAIAAEELDLLVYLDLGMDPFTLFLAHARLAPVQAVLWGHPDTTGIPAIDVFLSCDAMEPEDADEHYDERLVRLPGPGCWYVRPVDGPRPGAAEFGLPEQAVLYLCPQTPQKFHPDFDPVIRQILTTVGGAHLVLTAGWSVPLMERVKARITAPAPDLADRIHILPAMDRDRFMGLMRLCDVMLDPLHYSGGNSSLEALAFGMPIVTWPGRFMRARHTFGFYRLMGLSDCVARDPDNYVEIAVALGRDPAARAALRDKIRTRSACLFEDDLVVRAFEAFAAAAVGKAAGQR